MTTIYRSNGKYPQTISNTDDILDSRTIIETLEELKEEAVSSFRDEDEDFEGDYDDLPEGWLDEHEPELAEDIRVLEELCEEGRQFADWEYGETLIHDSYFVQYAEDLAHDVVPGMDQTQDWPFCHIDWEAAADSLRIDYSTIDFDGQTYWIR